MEVRRCCESDGDAWDRFVEGSINGTLMHTRRFLAYHPPDRFDDHSLLFVSDANRLIAVFPAAEVNALGERALRSHPGASYGGLIVDDQLPTDLASEIVTLLVNYAGQNSIDEIWMRVSERVFHRRYCDELEAALYQAGFQLAARELSSAVRLDGLSESTALSAFRDNSRQAVRKAKREGIVASPTDDYLGYWQLLARNLDERHGVRPTHTLEEILRLKEQFPDRVELIGAYHNDLLIAGTVVFIMNGMAAHTMYMAQDYRFQELRSLNLVLHEAVLQCIRRGMRWLNYGISAIPGTGGMETNDGLYNFKRSCGGEGVVRDVLVKRL